MDWTQKSYPALIVKDITSGLIFVITLIRKCSCSIPLHFWPLWKAPKTVGSQAKRSRWGWNKRTEKTFFTLQTHGVVFSQRPVDAQIPVESGLAVHLMAAGFPPSLGEAHVNHLVCVGQHRTAPHPSPPFLFSLCYAMLCFALGTNNCPLLSSDFQWHVPVTSQC